MHKKTQELPQRKADRYRFRNKLRDRLFTKVRGLSFRQMSVFRTLPSFLSLLVRIFYVTKIKYEELIPDNRHVDEDVYFDSVYRRFRLF